MTRLVIGAIIAAGVYATALVAGSTLYGSGAIGTGATHNDCADFRHEIARERGISDDDVPQSEIKARTQACLGQHQLTAGTAFRSEYLFWSLWPAIICGAAFFMWPLWARALERQEMAEVAREASHLQPGT